MSSSSKTAVAIFHPTFMASIEGIALLRRLYPALQAEHLDEYVTALMSRIEKSKHPVYVFHDENFNLRLFQSLFSKKALENIRFRQVSLGPRQVRELEKIYAELKREGIERVLLGGSVFQTVLPQPEARGCVNGALIEFRKRGFNVVLMPDVCWPEKGYEKPEQAHLRIRGSRR